MMAEDEIPIEFQISDNWNYGGVGLFGRQGKDTVMNPITFTKVEKFTPTPPALHCSRQTLQNLFNELWRYGLRPNDGTGNSGHIAAVKDHLEDMRRLVFEPVITEIRQSTKPE